MPTTNPSMNKAQPSNQAKKTTKTVAMGKASFMAPGPKFSKIRTTKITNFPTRRRPLDPEERKKLARLRWKKAIRKVRAMLKWHIKIDFKDLEEEKKPINLAPTYKIEPDLGKKFTPKSVETMIDSVLKDKLKEYEYSRFTAPKFAKILSGIINDRMKEMDFPRYKFITNVIMTDNANQCMDFTSRCAWDTNTDGYATAHFKKNNFVAIALVHGVYLD